MNGDIENCDWAFRIQCPQTWSGLAATGDPHVRTCGVCLKKVYRCDSREDVARHAALAHCIALFGASGGESEEADMLGEVIEEVD
jgi:hypothetical protein